MAHDPSSSADSVEEIQTSEFSAARGRERAEWQEHVDQLIAAGLRELEACGDHRLRLGRTHLCLALLSELRGDPRRAQHHYVEAWRYDPANVATLRTLRRVATTRRNWALVLQLLEQELSLEPAAAGRSELLCQQADVLDRGLWASEAAERALQMALDGSPAALEPLHRLRRLRERRGDAATAVALCRRAAEATGDARWRALLLGEAGRLLRDELGDVDGAVDCYAAACAEHPDSWTDRLALQQLLRAAGRWGELVEQLLAEAQRRPQAEQRSALLLEAARLCAERLQQAPRALELLRQAQEQSPDDQVVGGELCTLLDRLGRHEELVQHLSQRAELLQDAGERAAAHVHIGLLLREQLEQEAAAVGHLQRALTLEPAHVGARCALESICRGQGRWNELLQSGVAQAEASEDLAYRAGRLCQLGQLCEVTLGDAPRAIELYGAALTCEPHSVTARHSLARLYRAVGDWAALVELWEREPEALAVSGEGGLALEQGRVLEEHLHDTSQAIRCYRKALQSSPTSVAAMEALQRLLAQRGEWREVLELLDAEAQLEQEPELLLALGCRAAEVCEVHLADQRQARQRLERLLEQQLPEQPVAWQVQLALERLYDEQGQWEPLLQLYQRQLTALSDSPRRAALLLCRMATLCEGPLADRDRAVALYHSAVERDPAYVPAQQELARCLRAGGQWAELDRLLRRRASQCADPQRRAALLAQCVELRRDRLDDADGALRVLLDAVEQGTSREAMLRDAMELLGRQRRFGELVALLVQSVAQDSDVERKRGRLKQLAEIYHRRLMDWQQAVVWYDEALALDEDDVELLDALVQLHQRTGDHGRMAAVCERLAAATTDASQAVAQLFDAASLLEHHLPQSDPRAIYHQLLELSPGNRRALEALWRLHGEHGDRQQQLRVGQQLQRGEPDPAARAALLLQLSLLRQQGGELRQAAHDLAQADALVDDPVLVLGLRLLHQRLQQWPHVAQCLEREAQLTRNDAVAVERLMAAARLRHEQLDDPAGAIELLSAVLERAPEHDEAATLLEQLLVRRSEWPLLVQVIGRRLKALAASGQASTEQQVELTTRRAWILREHLGQTADAAAMLREALELAPNHLPTLMTLGELHLELEQWREAMEAYSRVVALSNDTDVLRRAHLALGELWGERLGDLQRAISSYQNVLAVAGNDLRALQRLRQLFCRAADWDSAVEMATRVIDAEREPDALVRHNVALADILVQGFDDAHRAARRLQQALAIAPADEEALQRLVRLLTRLEQWDDLAQAYRSCLAVLPAERAGQGIGRRLELGELLHRRLHRTAEALEQLEAAIEIDPTNVEARLLAATILWEEGRDDEALAQHRELQELVPLHLESLRQMGRLWARLGRPSMARAIQALLDLFGAAPAGDEARETEGAGRWQRRLRPLDGAAFDTVVLHPDEHEAGRQLLQMLSHVAHRLRGAKLEQWQVSKADRLPPQTTNPLRRLVDELCRALRLEQEVDIYVSAARPAELGLLLTDGPALVLGAGVLEQLGDGLTRFWAASLLSYIKAGTWLAVGLSGPELAMLVRGVCRAVDADIGFPAENPTKLEEMTRLVQRLVPRRTLRQLEQVCLSLVAGREPSYRDWAAAMQMTGVRAALCVTGQLRAGLSYLELADPELARLAQLAPAERVHLVRHNTMAMDLVQFWLSDELAALDLDADGAG